MNVTLELRVEDAEPILRKDAYEAAKYSAWLDHITKRTVSSPCSTSRDFDADRKDWNLKFLSNKRLVESFGIDYEILSEQEVLGVYIPEKVLKSRIVKLAGFSIREVQKSEPDPANAQPRYQSSICLEACKQAADRVVRNWQATLTRQAA